MVGRRAGGGEASEYLIILCLEMSGDVLGLGLETSSMLGLGLALTSAESAWCWFWEELGAFCLKDSNWEELGFGLGLVLDLTESVGALEFIL